MKKIPIILIAMLTTAASVPADSGDAAALADVLEQLGVTQPAQALPRAPIPGFVEIHRGLQVIYISVDGATLIKGDILSVATETNLTERRRSEIRRRWLRDVSARDRLVFPPAGSMQAKLVVFTDADCPYCRRFHQQRAELTRNGVEIQYLFYPRSGPASRAWDQAVSVWCAPDRAAALELALGGTRLQKSRCPNPVASHYELARRLDLKGTPAIITPDGSVLYGARTVSEILQAIGHPNY